MSAIAEIPRTRNPFPRTGIHVDEHGIPRYATLPDPLVGMLKASADTSPGAEAIVEIGGGRLSYEQLWDRGARVVGGLPAAGVKAGDRVSRRYPAGVNWVLAHCRERLADFKVPQYVTVADQPMPRNPSGKLLKAKLRSSVR